MDDLVYSPGFFGSVANVTFVCCSDGLWICFWGMVYKHEKERVINLQKRRDNPRRNSEGYSDPTPYEAIRKMDAESERFHRLIRTIYNICEMADFEVGSRIVLVDRKTGKIWR